MKTAVRMLRQNGGFCFSAGGKHQQGAGCRLVAFCGTAVLAVVKELQVCVKRGCQLLK